MVGSDIDLKSWLQMDEMQRVSVLRSSNALSFQLIVLASQDTSFIVRTTLLTIMEKKIIHDVKWVSLLRKISDTDPNMTLRKSASILLRKVMVAS